MAKRSTFTARLIRAASVLIGGIALMAFIGYPRATVPILPMNGPLASVLGWDLLLSLLFFIQHSVMIRRKVRLRLEAAVGRQFFFAVYSIASGLALLPVAILWQRSGTILYSLTGPALWVARGFQLLAAAGFAWGIFSMRPFDPFGVVPINAHLRGREAPLPRFIVRGPYRWVRHPLYACFLIIFWANPQATTDVIFGNVIWTIWTVVGTLFEERDLVADFAEDYRRYQGRVPMFVPWRGRFITTDRPTASGVDQAS
jgi:methanethiol S-methyltransferase